MSCTHWTLNLLCGSLTLSLSLCFRWKYGSRTNDPNTRRSWRTGPVDLRETTSHPRRRPPPPPAPCGTSAWPPKARRCTLEDTWTILLTGTRDTSRTPCRELRWCDSQVDATLPGQMMDLFQQDGAVRDTDIVASGGKNNITGRSEQIAWPFLKLERLLWNLNVAATPEYIDWSKRITYELNFSFVSLSLCQLSYFCLQRSLACQDFFH